MKPRPYPNVNFSWFYCCPITPLIAWLSGSWLSLLSEYGSRLRLWCHYGDCILQCNGISLAFKYIYKYCFNIWLTSGLCHHCITNRVYLRAFMSNRISLILIIYNMTIGYYGQGQINQQVGSRNNWSTSLVFQT